MCFSWCSLSETSVGSKCSLLIIKATAMAAALAALCLLAMVALARPELDCSPYSPPRLRYFRFVVEYFSTMGPACHDCPANRTACAASQCVTADGVQRAIITVNRQMPGPAIEVCQGDTIVVDVENHLPGTETGVHWHGLLQHGTQYMDGVPFVTQCPIPEGTTFRYQFVAKELGTFFWHSHDGFQKMDGFTGPLIVRSSSDPSAPLYDTDRHTVVLQDWTHQLTQGKVPGPLGLRDRGQQANTLLINGRGSYTDPESGNSTKTPLARLSVQSGKRHRLRVINSGCFECPLHLQVEGHRLTVIAVDGTPVRPVTVDTVIILPGERVDVVLKADQLPASYWVLLKALADCEDALIYQKALLVYMGSPGRLPATPDPGYAALPPGVVLNPMEAKCQLGQNAVCTFQLRSLRSPSPAPPASDVIKLKLDFRFRTYEHEHVFKQPSGSVHRPFYIPRDGDENNYELQAGEINNISLVLPPSPPLSQPEVLRRVLTTGSRLRCEPGQSWHQNCLHLLRIPLNNTVDITFVHDAEGEEGEAHPMHVHGHRFHVLYQGYDLADSQDDALINPELALKDTVNVPGSGIARIRFKANNPGFWLLHCHIIHHQVTGMAVLLQVGDLNDLPPVPEGFPTCGDFLPPYNRNRPSSG